MPDSVRIGFAPAMKTVSSRRLKRYPTVPTTEFPESLVSDSKYRVSRLRTRLSLGLGIGPMPLRSLGLRLGIDIFHMSDSESDSDSTLQNVGLVIELERSLVWADLR